MVSQKVQGMAGIKKIMVYVGKCNNTIVGVGCKKDSVCKQDNHVTATVKKDNTRMAKTLR